MQPLYFLPDTEWAASITVEAKRVALRERGLAEIFADVDAEQIGFNPLGGRGPGDRCGTIVFYNTAEGNKAPRRAGFYKAEQTWTPIDDGSKLWIGLDNASPPKPSELRRKRQFKGYEIELADGNRWQVPIIRRPADGLTSLPRDMYVEQGQLKQPIKAAFQHYWDATEEVADFFFNKGELTLIRAHDLAVSALGLNYRFGLHEQTVLRLVDGETWMALLGCTVDFRMMAAMAEAQKKSNLPPAATSSS